MITGGIRREETEVKGSGGQGYVRSDGKHDHTSKSLFSFGQTLIPGECKQFGLINVSV